MDTEDLLKEKATDFIEKFTKLLGRPPTPGDIENLKPVITAFMLTVFDPTLMTRLQNQVDGPFLDAIVKILENPNKQEELEFLDRLEAKEVCLVESLKGRGISLSDLEPVPNHLRTHRDLFTSRPTESSARSILMHLFNEYPHRLRNLRAVDAEIQRECFELMEKF